MLLTKMNRAFLFASGFLVQLYAIDCPNESAYFPDLDTTSITYGETVPTGLCACLGFSPTLTGTDSTVTLTILLVENEPLRAFQFEIVDNTDDALVLGSVSAGDKIEGWIVPGTETDEGNGRVFGFNLSGEETQPGVGGVLLEATFDITGYIGEEISFYLGESGSVLLADKDAQNVACRYPDADNPVSFPTHWTTTGIHEESLPVEFALRQNFPNPFNPITTVEFQLKFMTSVDLSVYNIVGQKVLTLVNRMMPAGSYQVNWDGRNHHGESVASGVYIYAIRTENFFYQRKMVLLR